MQGNNERLEAMDEMLDEEEMTDELTRHHHAEHLLRGLASRWQVNYEEVRSISQRMKDADSARLAEIHAQVANGNYSPDSREMAETLILGEFTKVKR